MPPVPPDFYMELQNRFLKMEKNLHAVMTNQNRTFCDNQSRIIMNEGMVVGSNPARFGLQFVNPANGLPVMEVSGNDVGMAQQTFYASDGETPLIIVNDTGMSVFSGSTEEVQLGEITPGLYGLAVHDPTTGQMFMVNAPQEAFVSTELSTTSTSYVDISGPSVTVTVGPSGRALVMPSTIIGIDGGTSQASFWQGLVGVELDGNLGGSPNLLGASSAPLSGNVAPIQITSSNSYMWTGLTSGSHTFKMVYRSVNGQSIHFSENSLVVIPY